MKGNNSREWAAAIKQRCENPAPPPQIIDAVVIEMRALYARDLPLLPGAKEIVEMLAERFPLAVASSSPPTLIDYVMSEAGIRDRFSVIVSADQVGRGKPAPDVFLVAGDKLGCSPETCAVFEDSSAGIRRPVPPAWSSSQYPIRTIPRMPMR